MNGKTMYGRRKLDEAAYARQEAAKHLSNREGTVYGWRKTGVKPPPSAAATEAPRTLPEDPEASIFKASGTTGAPIPLTQLTATLRERPQMLDAAIEHEFRQQTPRKGALELFSTLERQKDKPRPAVLDRLAAALA